MHPRRREWLRRAVWVLGVPALGAGPVVGAEVDPAALAGNPMPDPAFDALPATRVDIGGATLDIAWGPGAYTLARERLIAYVQRSAHAVAVYYGRFPAAHTRVLILNAGGSGRPVRSGMAFGERGAAVKLALSADVNEADLARDWVLVHEMCHLALPSLPRSQHWFEEGMATYVEPLARAQSGGLAVEQVWADMVHGMPQGLPQDGDRGLDHTPTWGRTYWGGAMFCLLADIGIRDASAGRKGLQHALRAILGYGNIERDAELDPLLQLADQAVGSTVLSEQYAQWKDRSVSVDLDSLWRRLGVTADAQGVHFDDDAPEAAVRAALTRPQSAG